MFLKRKRQARHFLHIHKESCRFLQNMLAESARFCNTLQEYVKKDELGLFNGVLGRSRQC